jgi:PAS domain S-box-containing protein
MPNSEPRAPGSHTGAETHPDAPLASALDGLGADPLTWLDWLTGQLTQELGVDHAFVVEVDPDHPGHARTLSVTSTRRSFTHFRFALDGTPCAEALGRHSCYYARDVRQHFPGDQRLATMGVEGFAGVALRAASGAALGVLAVASCAPLPDPAVVAPALSRHARRTAGALEHRRVLREMTPVLGWSGSDATEGFFDTLVRQAARAFEVPVCFVAVPDETSRGTVRTLAVHGGEAPAAALRYELDTAPCGAVYHEAAAVTWTRDAAQQYPACTWLRELAASSYFGLPIRSRDGAVIGHLALVDRRPFTRWAYAEPLLELLAARTAAELERLHSEEALRRTEARYQTMIEEVVDASDVAIVVVGRDSRVVWLNRATERFFGVTRAGTLGRDHGRVVREQIGAAIGPPEDFIERALRAASEQVLVEGVECRVRAGPERTERWLEYVARPIRTGLHAGGRIEQFTDVTALKREMERRFSVERRLLDAQRLEAMSKLAGGIAHGFNNLLAGILGNISLALADTPSGTPLRSRLDEVQSAARRAGDLALQLLAYAGGGQHAEVPVDVSALAEDTCGLLRAGAPRGVEMSLGLARGLPAVAGDPAHLGQALTQLVLNAFEAVSPRAGLVTVTTAMAATRERHVALAVTDNGRGIDPAIRARIFEPFFSAGFAGPGLGLTAVQEIVHTHGGVVEVESAPERGSTFRVLLPCASQHREAQSHAPEETPWAGTGTVLVVDDDDLVRSVVQRMLVRLGFEALLAADGAEALRLFEQRAPDVGLVILDLTLPPVPGEDLTTGLRRVRPDVRVVLTSGLNEPEARRRFAGQDIAGFLQKPFEMSEMRRLLRAVLAQG